jgi:hypothetical protein
MLRCARLVLLVSLSGVVGCTGTVSPPGTAAPVLTFSEGTTFDFGPVQLGSSSEHTFTVTNTGNAAATQLGTDAPSGAFSLKSSACGTQLAAGEHCSLTVTAAPAAAGVVSGQLTVHAAEVSGSISLSVTGVQSGPAVLALSDGPTFDFGAVQVGATSSHTLMLTNTGSQPAAQLKPAALSLPFALGSASTCGTSLAGGESCALVVTFAPTSGGAQSAMLTVAYNDGAQDQSVSRPLTGTGRAPATLTLSDGPSFDFGSVAVGGSATHTFDVVNGGSVAATALTAAALTAPFSFPGGFPGTGGDCATSLPAGMTCHVVVRFAPTAATTSSAMLSLSFDDGSGTMKTAAGALTGTGAPPATLIISDGPTYDFGTRGVNTAVDHVFTITNPSAVDATQLAAGAGLTAPFDFAGGSFPGGSGGTFCGSRLAALASCTVALTFSPTTAVTSSATLRLTYSNGVGMQTVSRPVTGTGTTSAFLTVSDAPSFDFGTQPVNASVDHTFIVSNTGAATASSIAVTAPTGAFSLKTNGCSAGTLAAAASCNVVVTFHPTMAGASMSSLGLSYNDSVASNVMASRTVRGTATDRAFLTLTDGPLYAFGPHPVGSSTEHSFTVTNTGAAAASSLSFAALASPFSVKNGTTCGGLLAVGGTCQVTVVFSPTQASAGTATLSLSYNDGGAQQMATRDVSATAVAPAALVVSDGPTYDFGAVAVNGAAGHVFFVSNTGGWPASSVGPGALMPPFQFLGGAWPGFGGDCGAVLAPGASCRVALSFSPTTAASASAMLSIGYNDGVATQSVMRALAGTGTSHAALVITDLPYPFYAQFGIPADPATYAFGSVGVGQTGYHPFSVTNVGGGDASALSGMVGGGFTFRGGGAAPGQGGSCTATLAVGQSCILMVSFVPGSAGPATGMLSLSYDDGGGTMHTAVRALSGTGTSAAALVLQDFPGFSFPYPIDLGTVGVGGVSERDLYVFNSGGGTATQVSGAVFGPGFKWSGGVFPGVGGTCSDTLPAGATCRVGVVFSPTTAGPVTDTLRITYFDGAAMQSVARGVGGTGTYQALLLVRPVSNGGPSTPAYGFATSGVGSSSDVTLQVVNLGGGDATQLMVSGAAAPFTVKSSTCGSAIPTGTDCQLVVTFHPTAAGTFFGSLTFSYNDGASTQSLKFGLSGTATANALVRLVQSGGGGGDLGPIDFGVTGTSLTRDFDVVNVGAANATAMSFATLAAPFSLSGNTCGAMLAPGARCTVTVRFAPSGGGVFGATLRLSYQDGSAAASVAQDVTGTGTSDAVLSITDCMNCGGGGNDGPHHDFGLQGAPQTATFYVTNVGPVATTSLSLTLPSPSAPFSITQNDCTAVLAAGATCTLTVTFTPTVAGYFVKALTASYADSAGAQPPVTVALSGTASVDAILVISDCNNCGVSYDRNGTPRPFDFGLLGVPGSHTFGVTNIGSKPATGLSFAAMTAPFSVTSTTCGATLNPTSSCTVIVTFTPPTTAGDFAGTLTVNYSDSLGAQPAARRGVIGTATSNAHLVMSTCSNCGDNGDVQLAYIFPVIGLGSSATTDFYVYNNGGQDALGLTFTGLSGAFSITQNTCGPQLARGASCQLTVRFAPTAAQSYAQTLSLAYSDSSGAQPSVTRDVQGTGTGDAMLGLTKCQGCGVDGSTGPLDFGVQGMPTTQTFYLVNTGGSAVTSLSFAALTGPFALVMNQCTAPLAPGASCLFGISFTPQGNGSSSTMLSITFGDAGGPQPAYTRQVTGTSSSRALVSITDCFNCGGGGGGGFQPPIDFGQTGVPVSRTLQLVNSGAQNAVGIAFSGVSGAFAITANNCSTTLAAGATCDFTVTFTPATGMSSSNINVDYGDAMGSLPQATRSLTGTAITYALLGIADCDWCGTGTGGGPFDFGTHGGMPVSNRFTVKNMGGAATTALSIGALSSPFSRTTDCTAVLAPGASCSVTVTFTPPLTSMSYPATLTVSYADTMARPDATRGLTATATDRAVLSISECTNCGGGGGPPQPMDFGTTGVPATRTLNVTNVGASTTLSMSVSNPGAPFSVGMNTCGAQLPPGMSCSFAVTFTPPPGNGMSNGSVSVSYSDVVGMQPAVLKGLTGTSTDRAVLVLEDCQNCGGGGTNPSPYDFGTVGQPTSRTFFLVNTGRSSTVGLAVGGLSAPFGLSGCTGELAAGAGCNLTVTFGSTADMMFSQMLTISYGDSTGSRPSVTRGMLGTGSSRALLELSDGCCGGSNYGPNGLLPFDYGTWGIPSRQTFQVRNVGGQATTSLSFDAGSPFFVTPGSMNPCPANLPNNGMWCDLDVVFMPSGSSTVNQTLVVGASDSAGARPPVTRALTATSTTQPRLLLQDFSGPPMPGNNSNPGPYSFGVHGTRAWWQFWVYNVGGSSITDLSGTMGGATFAFDGDGGFPGTMTGDCGAFLPPDAGGCHVGVTFNPPPGSEASFNGLLTVGSTGAAQQVTRAVTATATDRAVVTEQDMNYGGCGEMCGPRSFGQVPHGGGTITADFSFFNGGALDALSVSLNNPGNGFSVTAQNCTNATPPTLTAGGANCTVTVTFAPASAGTFNATLMLSYTDSIGGNFSVSRSLSGNGT